jgi:hypothetical protein
LRPENIVHQTMKISSNSAAPASNTSIHITFPYVFDTPKCTRPQRRRGGFHCRLPGRLHHGAAATGASTETAAETAA